MNSRTSDSVMCVRLVRG